ncbi:hypothetical protein BR93DRAFT_878021 [Coniochaeta sp. PMI_546]|nr:hypothetical protein BR93DRAFT_878021 [Coniochaeta sp. PMI_546]
MEDTNELETLRRLLREEQRRREEAESQREEERRRREAAEQLATTSQPLNFEQYLEACHSLDLAVQVVTDRSLTTQGETTDPSGRIFPRRIIPWDDFSVRQEEIWDELSVGTIFFSVPAFPSQHQLDYVRSRLKPISSELGLRDFECEVVENAVQQMVDRISADPLLRSTLGLRGTVTFESHTNLGVTDNNPISGPLDLMSIENAGASAAGGMATATTTAPASSSSSSATAQPPAAAPRARLRARGKGNRADQFCAYRTSDGQSVPVLAIKHKAPHKLSVDELVTGLESEIQPERDIINKDGQGFAFTAKRLAAAVVTQLFSYMVGKGIQYGYICTGEAFVFLHVPDDPANVYFSICVPSLDVLEDDETRLHRTAAAQVFAFILQAIRKRPPPQSWHDEAERLDTWVIEYDDVLRSIPVTERKRGQPRASPYKPQRWKGFQRSPIRTRSRCQQLDAHAGTREDDDDDADDGGPPSPTSARGKTASSKRMGSRGGRNGGQPRGQHHGPSQTESSIHTRPFCTQQCLLALAYGLAPDKDCPNSQHHERQGRIDRLDFLDRIREQLARDRGPGADCTPLYRSGARGSLYKVRLSTHGYTLVVKGVESVDRACLQHENDMYDRLRPIQGKYVPVCLSSIDLLRPHHYDGRVHEHFLFLGWAGRPLFECHGQASRAQLVQGVAAAFKAIHSLRVLHHDAEPRNMLGEGGRLMVVDFERAEFRGRQPLSPAVANGQALKRKRGKKGHTQGKDDFASELECAVETASRCIAGPTRLQSLVKAEDSDRSQVQSAADSSKDARSPPTESILSGHSLQGG